MTTIAFDGKTLACDGRISDTMVWSDDYKKILRVGDLLIGWCGEVANAESVMTWLRSGCKSKRPSLKGVSVMFIDPTGKVFVSDGTSKVIECHAPFAIGSGRAHAMGAMDSGASAVQAIRAAIKRDPDTGGRIRSLRLRNPK